MTFIDRNSIFTSVSESTETSLSKMVDACERSNEYFPRLFLYRVDANERLRLVFFSSDVAAAFAIKRSLGQFLGDFASHKDIRILPVSNLRDRIPHLPNTSANENIAVICDAYSKHDLQNNLWTNPKNVDSQQSEAWFLKKCLEFKKLWQLRPSMQVDRQMSLQALLTNFYIDLKLGERERLTRSFGAIAANQYLDARNENFLRLLMLDSIADYPAIIEHSTSKVVIAGRLSSDVLNLFLRALLRVRYSERITIPWLDAHANDEDKQSLRKELLEWREIFLKSQYSLVDQSDHQSEFKLLALGVELFGGDSSAVLKLVSDATWIDRFNAWRGKASANDDLPDAILNISDCHQVTVDTEYEQEGWLAWFDQYSMHPEIADSLNDAHFDSSIWWVDNSVLERFCSVCEDLGDYDRGRFMRCVLPLMLERLLYPFEDSTTAIDPTYLISLSQTLALETFYNARDFSLQNALLRVFIKNSFNKDHWLGMLECIEIVCDDDRITATSLPEIISLLELAIDHVPGGRSSILPIWVSSILPFVKSDIRLPGSTLNIVNSLSKVLSADLEVLGVAIDKIQELPVVDKTIGIYSLDETCLRRVKSILETQYPNLSIILNSDKICTSALKNLALRADSIFFASGRAKHQAFYCLDNVKHKLNYPEGNGTTAMVRAIEDYLGELAN